MDANEILRNYVLPLFLTILLIVTALLMGLLNLTNVVLASVLFVMVGLCVFSAELLVSKIGRIQERRNAFSLLSSVLVRDRPAASSGLLTLDDVIALESASEEVWIYAFDMAWEDETSPLPSAVRANLLRGVRYRYVVPDTGAVRVRVDNLRHRYAGVPNLSTLLSYRTRKREEKLIQFGVAIYNPSLLSGGRRAPGDVVVVFFPHYNFCGPGGGAAFVTMRGESTVQVQEAFVEVWNSSTEIPEPQQVGI